MNFLRNFGLDFLVETDEETEVFLNATAAMAKPIVGYYGCPYLNTHYGWVQCILRTEVNKQEKRLELTGFDTHISGDAVWEFGITTVLKNNEEDKLCKKVLAYNKKDGKGVAVINIVNADVLPSYLPDDTIVAQMVGFPVVLFYYPNEEEYENALPKTEKGQKVLLKSGMMMPISLCNNKNKESEDDDLMLIRGNVKKVQKGVTKFDETFYNGNYMVVTIETDFGDLEIVHTLDQVNENQRQFITEGSVVYGAFYLSADVAIYQYDKSFAKDRENNLALLRAAFQRGEFERLRYVLSEEVQYYSEYSDQTFFGKDGVIDRLNFVAKENASTMFFAHFAEIKEVLDGEEQLPYGVGEKCLIIAKNMYDELDAICFVEHDDDDKISRLYITRNSRYKFNMLEYSYPE